MGRDTVAKRITAANVKPAAMRSGHPVYRLRDVATALLALQSIGEDGERDPRLMSPTDRKAWYQSEIARFAVETEARQLIPAAEVEAEQAELVKGLVQFLDTLGDQLERDCALTPEQVDAVNASIGRLRQTYYERLVREDDERLQA